MLPSLEHWVEHMVHIGHSQVGLLITSLLWKLEQHSTFSHQEKREEALQSVLAQQPQGLKWCLQQ